MGAAQGRGYGKWGDMVGGHGRRRSLQPSENNVCVKGQVRAKKAGVGVGESMRSGGIRHVGRVGKGGLWARAVTLDGGKLKRGELKGGRMVCTS